MFVSLIARIQSKTITNINIDKQIIKPPTLGIFSPPQITCDVPVIIVITYDGHPILVLQEVHRSLWMRCACCQCLM